MMRYWKYIEPTDPKNNDFTAKVFIVSDQEIMEAFWDHWLKKIDKIDYDVDEQDPVEDCIQDWVAVNWATEVKDPWN